MLAAHPVESEDPFSGQRICLVNGFGLVVVGLGLLWKTPDVLINATILGVGLLLLCLGLRLEDGRWLARFQLQLQWLGHWLGVSPLQVLLLLNGLLLSLGAGSAAGDDLLARSSLHGWLWLGGILLAAAGLWDRADRPRFGRETLFALALAAGIALLALGVRSYRLESLPFAVNGDEGSGGLTGLEFVRATRSNLFNTAWHSFPSFYFWLISLSQRALGPSLLAARLPSALAGVMAVVATYWTGSRMFSRTQGALAALLLAGSHVHLMFSRVAVNNVWDSFFLALVIGTVWVAWTSNARWAFLLAGAGVGLGQLFYPTGHLLVAAVPLWLLFLAKWAPASNRTPGVVGLGLMSLVTIFPLGKFYAAHWNEFLNPLSGVAMADVGRLLSGQAGWREASTGALPTQFWTSALGLVAYPIRGVYHPSAPMLLPATAVLFCLGGLMLVRRLRDPRSLILLTALLGAILTGTLSVEAPNGHRMQGILPVLALIAALGPAWAVEQAARARSPILRHGAAACVLVGVVWVAGSEARYFFLEAIPEGAYGDSSTYASRVVSEFAASLPEGTAIVLYGVPRLSFANFPSLHYLIQDQIGCDGSWPPANDCRGTTRSTAYVFLVEQQGRIADVRTAYPSGREVVLEEMPGNAPILAWVVSD